MALSRPPLPDWRDRMAAYASLVRVPNLFTAPPDVLLGAGLGMAAGGSLSRTALGGVAVASVLLYAAGTTLNDYFDAPVDATERPERPIPSGRVSRRAAAGLGAGLLTGGVLLAWLAAGPAAGAVATALALTILLYDGVLKGSPPGYLAMGVTRGINVWLGAAAAGALFAGPRWSPAVPLVVAAYVASVTYMADTEVEGGDGTAVLTALAGAVGAALTLVGVTWLVRPPPVRAALALGLGVAFLAWTGRTLLTASRDPRPAVVGPAVGTCVLALVVLDAAFAAVVDPALSVAALAFLAPAVGLSSVFDVS